MKKRTKWIVLLALVFVVLLFEIILLVLFRVQHKLTYMTVELGELVSDDPRDYLDGMEWSLQFTNIDLSQVNQLEVGTYPIHIEHGFRSYECIVKIQDTTAPTLEPKVNPVYVQCGKEYSVNKLIRNVKDESRDVTVTLSDGSETVCFDSCGEKALEIWASDPSGNRASINIPLIVDSAPVFDEFPEYYVAIDSEIDFLDGIDAYDEVDGDVSESIHVDTRFVNLKREGNGKIRYRVTDSYGLTSKKDVMVHVCSQDTLQELIDAHQINRFDQRIIGAKNLYDAGYYTDTNVRQILERMEPTLVRIRKEYENRYTFGSGFIAEITENDIVLCTNHHVIGMEDHVDVYFHDGTKAEGTVIANSQENISEKDFALISVARDDVSEDVLDTLYTVHINKEYWNKLPNENDFQIGIRCIEEKGHVWIDRVGDFQYKEIPLIGFESEGIVSKIDLTLQNGMSGSPVFDCYGNLMGMAVCVATVDGVPSYWCVTLKSILDLYEEYMGRCLAFE